MKYILLAHLPPVDLNRSQFIERERKDVFIIPYSISVTQSFPEALHAEREHSYIYGGSDRSKTQRNILKG